MLTRRKSLVIFVKLSLGVKLPDPKKRNANNSLRIRPASPGQQPQPWQCPVRGAHVGKQTLNSERLQLCAQGNHLGSSWSWGHRRVGLRRAPASTAHPLWVLAGAGPENSSGDCVQARGGGAEAGEQRSGHAWAGASREGEAAAPACGPAGLQVQVCSACISVRGGSH